MPKIKSKKISIVMGSQSDFKTMIFCQNILKKLGLKFETNIISSIFKLESGIEDPTIHIEPSGSWCDTIPFSLIKESPNMNWFWLAKYWQEKMIISVISNRIGNILNLMY